MRAARQLASSHYDIKVHACIERGMAVQAHAGKPHMPLQLGLKGMHP